ncbi:dipeptidase [Paenibacillus thalictri]|uniref:Dipeptidase n=1 Tax=Paenibacillus thalictri TaxID=2527873 RepID=A0A4V2J4N0_9BACL|nr:dipeptidase [Paenibacillus thalictri]TBL80391.1 dipeptidase [Paenibacillus thalictri]
MSDQLEHYFTSNRQAHLEELSQFLRIPSISVGTEHKEHIRKAAAWLADSLKSGGMEHAQLLETGGNPVVYADWLHAPGKPTLLIYGHYDVQPSDPDDRWDSPPFEPTIRDGKLYARGATDDKGQLFIHMKAVAALLATEGKLPVNIKWCIEGEEEIASKHLFALLEKEAEKLQADAVVISDGPMQERGVPSILYGLRGLCGFQLDVTGPRHDLHSGLYGGGVQNPIFALSELLASMKNNEGTITIDGFYEGVEPLSEADRERFTTLKHDDAKVQRDLAVNALFGEAGYSFLERTTARPTLEIHTITGGFQGEGIKPIVPSSASAKLSCRLVDQQDPDRIFELIERHIELHKPAGVEVKLTLLVKGKPFRVSTDNPYIQAAARAYEAGFGASPVFVRAGGSIPIVDSFSRLLEAPVVLMNFGLPDENLHAPNEHFHLENFDLGLRTVCHFVRLVGAP